MDDHFIRVTPKAAVEHFIKLTPKEAAERHLIKVTPKAAVLNFIIVFIIEYIILCYLLPYLN